MEISDGVHRIEVRLGRRKLYLYLYTGDVNVLLDTGIANTPAAELARYMSEIGMQLNEITLALNTHCDADHFGGNSELKKLSPRTVLTAHQFDRSQIESPENTMNLRYLQFEREHGIALPDNVKAELRSMMGEPTPLDLLVNGGEEIRIDDKRRLKVLHTPGHSKGHISLYDRRDRAIYIGDAVLWKYIPASDGRPALPPSYLYPDEYVSSIRMLMEMRPNRIYTAHFDEMLGDEADRFLQESLQFVSELENVIVEVHKEAGEPLTLKRIIEEVYARYRLWPEEAKWDLAYPVSGHVDLMVSKGLLKAVMRDGVPAWVLN
ncbi:Hydroxyacylglutathione hydrolase [archaeon HR01]|nr:Hydroxyacylglutathione hydrolase [archaeon HR01]